MSEVIKTSTKSGMPTPNSVKPAPNTSGKAPKRARENFFRDRLFNSPFNSIVTIVALILVVRVLIMVIDWGIINATWIGDSKQICGLNSGACWIFIREKFWFFIYGFIPKTQYWRINVLVLAYILLLLLVFSKKVKNKTMLLGAYLVIIPLITFFFAQGGFILPRISINQWGGFMLTLVFSMLGLLFSFPLGVLLALGRRSNLPVIKNFSVAYIEFFRGVPLITILFMSSTVLPFFFPPGVEIDKTIRVTIGFALFQSAYLAEVVRGGLQTVGKIQYESADSLGLSYMQKMYYIILPQALRKIVANIGDISISFIKDTTLVYIIGLFDMLGIYVPLTSDSAWLGTESEALFFSGLLYWALCYSFATLIRLADKKINKHRKEVMI